MWRDQLDIFWDGGRLLVLGFFTSVERAPAFGGRPDLMVFAAPDPLSGETTLLDMIDAARWRCGHCVITLATDQSHVGLRAPDGAELRIALTSDKVGPATGGEWRLLLTLAPETGSAEAASFRVAALSARADFERLARDHVVQNGARLVWASGQRRNMERRDGVARQMQLWPAGRVFPAWHSRIVLEPLDIPNETGAEAQAAPFAILDCWLREHGAPRAILRLRVPDSLDESAGLLNRTFVVLVMHQRRRLRDWMRDQKEAGDPIIDPLSFEDIRAATRDPGEHPDAVEASDSIVVVNLLKLVTKPEEAEFDGFALRRLTENQAPGVGAAFDLEFYGAALGDDLGVVSISAEAGDFGAAPIDPGGAPNARLFRIESDGLRPRRVAEDEALLDELLRRAANVQSSPSGSANRSLAERVASLHGRREKLVALFNAALARTGFQGRLEAAGAWEALEPLLFASFSALVEDASPRGRALLHRLGGYGAFRADPSLLTAMTRRPEFAEAAEDIFSGASQSDTRSLVYRFAGVCGAEGLAPPFEEPAAHAQFYRQLVAAPGADRLAQARIALTGDAEIDRHALDYAESLADEATVLRAAAYFDDLALVDEAEELRAYLAARRRDEWTPAAEAGLSSALVVKAVAAMKQAEAEAQAIAAAPPLEPPPPPKPKGLLAGLRGMFGR
jgi:hypothetical protein